MSNLQLILKETYFTSNIAEAAQGLAKFKEEHNKLVSNFSERTFDDLSWNGAVQHFLRFYEESTETSKAYKDAHKNSSIEPSLQKKYDFLFQIKPTGIDSLIKACDIVITAANRGLVGSNDVTFIKQLQSTVEQTKEALPVHRNLLYSTLENIEEQLINLKLNNNAAPSASM